MFKKSGSGFNFFNAKGGMDELKRRFFFVIKALIIFRIGSFIPIPGIDSTVLAKLIEQQRGTIIEMFNMFSGGALSRASIFALGIMPYISASIIVQLLTVIHPVLSEIKKEGEVGRRKISQYTRYGTLILAIFQSIGIATGIPNMPAIEGLVINPGFVFYFTAVISLACGTMFLMWLGEKITERGIGNGISIIIFTGILSGLPPAIGNTIEQARQGDLHFLLLILIIFLVFAVTFFVVFVERGQRRIVVNYAQRHQGRRVYAAQSTHLPLKVNIAGVIPAIFATSIILFPATLVSWFGGGTGWNWLATISIYLQTGQPLYVLLYASAIIFFCFFYTALIFNPRETAENLKKSGAFVPGIRPGEQTARYIDKVMTRLTMLGAMYITFICLIPEFMREAMKVPFYFGGTSLLIVVVVIMDFMAQVQTLMMSSQYESALKKANLKGYNR
ncbi:MAG: preprotein translocase subunit SecY [Sodalis sp. (in: enterobacteria)]